jgi:mRNA-degrading endonuclease YafQ of YafQ-DinJ toxin-antitoxin module
LEEENKYLSDRSTSLYAELNKSKKLVNKLNKVILKLQHQKELFQQISEHHLKSSVQVKGN